MGFSVNEDSGKVLVLAKVDKVSDFFVTCKGRRTAGVVKKTDFQYCTVSVIVKSRRVTM